MELSVIQHRIYEIRGQRVMLEIDWQFRACECKI